VACRARERERAKRAAAAAVAAAAKAHTGQTKPRQRPGRTGQARPGGPPLNHTKPLLSADGQGG